MIWLLILSCSSGATGAADALHVVDEVRRTHASALNAIETGRIEYTETYVSYRKPDPDLEASLARALADYPEQREETTRVRRLNTTTMKTVKVEFRASSSEWKIRSSDVRDLDEIATRERLSPAGRMSLDTSTTMLTKGSLEVTRLASGRDLLMMERRPQQFSGSPLLGGPLRFGIVADSIYRNFPRSSVDIAALDDLEVLCITLESERGSYKLEVDPAIGYHCRRIRVYSKDGELRIESLYKDYRLVNGIHFPFHYERNEYDSDGRLKAYRKLTVETASFNQGLPPDTFVLTVPAGAEVRLLDQSGRILRLPQEQEQVLDIEGLLTLMESVSRE